MTAIMNRTHGISDVTRGSGVALRANDGETSAPLKFKLEGVGNSLRGHAQQDAPASR